ncbi:MAG: LON peptidase substrate-binding domain-containing protein, partial [Chloroflexota bacterium]
MTTRPTSKKASPEAQPAADETIQEGAAEAAPAAKPKPPVARRTRSGSRTRKPAPMLLPVLVVEETLLLPHRSIPFPVEDEEAALALDRASRMEPRLVLVLTERPVYVDGDRPADEDGLRQLLSDVIAAEDPDHVPGPSRGPEWVPDHELPHQEYELCPVGVIAEVGQRISRPGGQSHVILQGMARGLVTELVQQEPYLVARVTRHDDPVVTTKAAEAAMTAVLEQVESYISMLPNVPEEVLTMIRGVDEPGWLADLIAFSPEFTSEQRQELLEALEPIERLHLLSVMVQKRLDVLNFRQQIQSEAQAGMDKQQREYYLREQLRAIQKELGEGSSEAMAASEMREKIEAAGMPEEVKAKALVQAERLEQQHPFSPEISIIRGYLEWLTELPWAVETEDRLDLAEAAAVLEADHYGLEKV